MNKFIPFLIGLFLVLPLGVPYVSAWSISHVETECGLFDCYTQLYISANIPAKYIGHTYTIGQIKNHIHNFNDKIENSYIKLHKGGIKILYIEVMDQHNIKLYGKIDGASQNKWGAVILGNNDFENSTWWNSSFNSKEQINVTENSGYNLIEYPITFFLNHSGQIKNDCSDLRLINETSEANFTFGYRNCNASWVEMTTKINISANATITDMYAYFNNTNATGVNASWNETRYNLFADWENCSIADNETCDSDFVTELGSIADVGGYRVLDTGASSIYINSSYFVLGSQKFILQAREISAGDEEYWYFITKDNNDNRCGNRFGDDLGKLYQVSTTVNDGSATTDDKTDPDRHTNMNSDNEWHLRRITRVSDMSSIDFELYDFEINPTDFNETITSNVMNKTTGRFEIYTGKRSYNDWIKVWQVADPEPTISTGEQEFIVPPPTTTTLFLDDPRYSYLSEVDYEMWTYGAIVFLFAVIFFIWI